MGSGPEAPRQSLDVGNWSVTHIKVLGLTEVFGPDIVPPTVNVGLAQADE